MIKKYSQKKIAADKRTRNVSYTYRRVSGCLKAKNNNKKKINTQFDIGIYIYMINEVVFFLFWSKV